MRFQRRGGRKRIVAPDGSPCDDTGWHARQDAPGRGGGRKAWLSYSGAWTRTTSAALLCSELSEIIGGEEYPVIEPGAWRDAAFASAEYWGAVSV